MRALVLTFDHLPLSCLGSYGNTWIETPHLDRLAAQGIVFDGCYSADHSADSRIPPWWSGQISLAAGAAPGAHLIDILRASGVRTTLCIERGKNSQAAAAFDEVHETEGSDAADAPARERPFARLVADAVDCWQRHTRSSEPWLLWVASRGVPSPWLPPREIAGIYWEEFFDAESLRLALAAAMGDETIAGTEGATCDPEQYLTGALQQLADTGLLSRRVRPELEEFQALNRMVYASYVSAIDAWCGTLLDAMSASASDDLLLIVTAAAGDLLAAHPCVERGCPPIVDALVHVPLVVRIGPGEAAGSRRGGLVSTADIPATLAAWFQVEGTTAFGDSRNLLPMVRCESDVVRHDVLFGADGIGWGVRTPEFSCLCAPGDESDSTRRRLGRPWLFSKPDDAGDVLDVADQNPVIAESLAQRISIALRSGAGRASEAVAGPAP